MNTFTSQPHPRWIAPLTVGNAVASGILLLMVIFSQTPVMPSATSGQAGTTAGATTSAPQFSDAQVQAVAARLIPTGKPFYGDELGISYDEAEKGITTLAQFDSYGSKPIKLTGDKLDRYVKMGMSIACEFCCGAKTMTTQTGDPACGCAHSQAMRGVALYLLDKYGDSKSDQEIFAEIQKWKALSFPQDTVKKYLASTAGASTGSTGSTGALGGLQKQVGGC